MAQKEHPLIVHSFVLMAVGAAVVVYGAIGLVQIATAKPEAPPPVQKAPAKPGAKNPHQKAGGGNAAEEKAKEAQEAIAKEQARVQGVQQNAQALGQKPSLATAGQQIGAVGALAGQASAVVPYLQALLIILVGACVILSGVFVLKRANWARFLGFAMLTAALIYFAFLQSGPAGLGDPRNDVVLPIIAMLVVTLLASKFLWDLWVEDLEAA